MAKTVFNMANGILTPCNAVTCYVYITAAMWHDHDIDFARWLHPAMWHVALESWQWIHQVAAPCNVIRDSGMTCHWIRSNGLYWNPTSGFDFDHITAVDMRVSEILSKSDHLQQNKMTSCRFSRWRISLILDFRDPIMGSLKSLCASSYRSPIENIALTCLVFEKIEFFAFWCTRLVYQSPPTARLRWSGLGLTLT